MFKRSQPSAYEQAIAQFERDTTPWCVCDKCIDEYFVDVPGSTKPSEISDAMLSDKAVAKQMIDAIKRQYSLEQVREKVRQQQMWFVEDSVLGKVYPIPPTAGDWILKELEQSSKPAPAK
jgi:hypothetical protein